MYHEKTTHIDVRYTIREIISYGQIVIKKIGTTNNPTDMMIESLSASSLNIAWT